MKKSRELKIKRFVGYILQEIGELNRELHEQRRKCLVYEDDNKRKLENIEGLIARYNSSDVLTTRMVLKKSEEKHKFLVDCTYQMFDSKDSGYSPVIETNIDVYYIAVVDKAEVV